jgi:hypothetical protein
MFVFLRIGGPRGVSVLGMFRATWSGGFLKGGFGTVEDLFGPSMDQPGLDVQFLGQFRHRLPAGQTPPDDLLLLLGGLG